MSSVKSGAGRTVLAIVLAGFWVNLFEFARNQLMLLKVWQGHFQGMGLVFPAAPLNGMMWIAWGFLAAGSVFVISRRFGLWQTTFLAWVMAYVMMWAAIWNLSVLPLGILPLAVPMGFVEAFGAAFISRKLAPANRT